MTVSIEQQKQEFLTVLTEQWMPPNGWLIDPDTEYTKCPLLQTESVKILKQIDDDIVYEIAVLIESECISVAHYDVVDDSPHTESEEFDEANQAAMFVRGLVSALESKVTPPKLSKLDRIERILS